MSDLKIAIDSGPLGSGDSVRGIGVYTRELINKLKLKTPASPAGRQNSKLKIESIDLSKADLSKYDVVHFTSFKPFSISLPFFKPKGVKFVITVYDLIPLIYPRHYPSGIRGSLNFLINKYLIRKNIDAIITISETSKKDICRFLGINPMKVYVIYLAPRSEFKKLEIRNLELEVAKRYGLPSRFALYVGDINYNKNIPVLLEACRLARTPLVICGKQASEIEELNLDHAELKHLKNLDWTGVIRLGFVSDKDLAAIYNLASVYIQPSLYEGFGLPVLEAVSCGTPLVATKTQALVEILGDGVDCVDPHDPKAMAESILNPNKNVKLPRIYSWDKTARETLKLYEEV
jgi:glycosyltransferase involved in cell wall biosynthesis